MDMRPKAMFLICSPLAWFYAETFRWGHVGLQFGEVDGLFECHGVILSVDRRWTDRGKDRGHESGLHPPRGGMKWSTPGAGLL